ncbi:MAG TPA: acyl carrier protein [Kofleriaceae bacterium]|nr:acyl carrier protein [Kofleriaceae bacterium]
MDLTQLAAVVARHRPDNAIPGADEPFLDELDSLAVLRLVLDLGQTFRIAIDGSQVTSGNFGTVRALGAMLERLAAARGAPDDSSGRDPG